MKTTCGYCHKTVPVRPARDWQGEYYVLQPHTRDGEALELTDTENPNTCPGTGSSF